MLLSIEAEKIQQIPQILRDFDLDAWLLCARETRLTADPVYRLLITDDVTWESFFLFHRDGRTCVLVGNFDLDIFTRNKDGLSGDVRTYTEGVKEALLKMLGEYAPRSIGVNYSLDDPSADGLSHGLFLRLQSYLKGTEFENRITSAERASRALRARKTPTEIRNLSEAARIADDIWRSAVSELEVGQSEIEIADLLKRKVTSSGCTLSFETAANAGDKSSAGHGRPTDARLAAGDLLHVDFGTVYEGYCSDIQRLLYFRRPGETEPPAELREAFSIVVGIIDETARQAKPGKSGWEIDAVARQMLKDNGYPEYQHALGHQLGQSVHDGGAIIGPRWDRYGQSPSIPLEENNVFTLELEIVLPGIGCVGLEEDVRITSNGAEFIGPRQTELLVK
jgi:Xaa-Pro aminopeptidase